MKILVIGGGAREHALAWKLSREPDVESVICTPGNPGIASAARCLPADVSAPGELLAIAEAQAVDLTVVGPELPLSRGVVDVFTAAGRAIVGPTKAAAALEWSKAFAKDFMARHRVPTAAFRVCESADEALTTIRRGAFTFPLVLKADGLAAGKGVVIAQDPPRALEAITDMIDRGRFGAAGAQILIEEFLEGWECSVQLLVDGDRYQLLGTACDHKRLNDGNEGPNTGGMGAYSPAVAWDAGLEKHFHEKIMQPTLCALREEKLHFSGLLFPGLMINRGANYVLEFNCRFGDPETQVVLPRLRSDLLGLLEATIDGRIDEMKIEMDDRKAVTVVMASAGYPGNVMAGKKISGLEAVAKMPDVYVFHAGTRRENGDVFSSGGRVLAVTALGETLVAARDLAYAAVSQIDFEGCHFRRDIALTGVPVTVAPSDAASRPHS